MASLDWPEKGGEDMIRDYGYPVERHYPVTSDGFILGMFRIPYGRDDSAPAPDAPPRPAVFLQHGLLDSSDTWILNGPGEAFAFILADEGFDVWLGNNRGNLYSRNHTSYNPSWPFKRFWDWTFTEMGRIDAPTQVHYIQKVTGNAKVAMAGHSQGCTQMMVNFCRPETLKDDLSVFVALAPAVHVRYTSSLLLRALASFGVDKLVQLLQINEFLPHTAILELLLPGVCSVTPSLCTNALYLIAGFERDNYFLDRLPMYMAHYPAGVSTKDMSHWAQGIRFNDRFQDYNYGPIKNLIKYGSASPPRFDLSSAQAPPIALFYGGKDTLAVPRDVEMVKDALPEGTLVFEKYIDRYDHLAFSWGKDANEEIYFPAIDVIRQSFVKAGMHFNHTKY